MQQPVLQKNSLLFVQLTHTVGEVAHTDCRGDVVVIVANTIGTEIRRQSTEVRYDLAVVSAVLVTATRVLIDKIIAGSSIQTAVRVDFTLI